MWCLKLLIYPSHCSKWLFLSCTRIYQTLPDHVFVWQMWAWSLHADFKNWISGRPLLWSAMLNMLNKFMIWYSLMQKFCLTNPHAIVVKGAFPAQKPLQKAYCNLWTSNKVIIEIWKDAPFLLDTLCLHKFWDMKNGHFPITMCPPCPPFHLRIGKISVVTAPKSNSDVDRKGWTDTSWGWMNLGKWGIGVTPIMWLLGG